MVALTGENYELEEKLHLYPGEAAVLPISLAKFMRCLLCLGNSSRRILASATGKILS